MSTIAILLICFQACLIQAVFGACGYGTGSDLASAFGYGEGLKKYGADSSYRATSYNSKGSGNVAAFGEMAVTGSTSVAGSLPVLGEVSFGGPVPAHGLVTISGSCAYPQPKNYGAAIAGAELAGIKRWNNAGAWTKPACGCSSIY